MWNELLQGVREQHAFLDVFARSWMTEYCTSGHTVHCGKGCAGCCTLVVNTTLAEAVAIAEGLSVDQMERVRAHVERLLQKVGAISELPAYLRMHRREMGRCPLLDDEGACTVYPHRPLSCRSLLSTRESRWCSVDFATVSAAEKEAFMAGLDRTVVAFPLHYVAVLQETGRELEEAACRRMRDTFGFALYGNLPVLLTLVGDHRFHESCAAGRVDASRVLASSGLDHPLLVTFSD